MQTGGDAGGRVRLCRRRRRVRRLCGGQPSQRGSEGHGLPAGSRRRGRLLGGQGPHRHRHHGAVQDQQLGVRNRAAAGSERPRGYQPRGKALGGSSAINAMVYIRGHRSDYDGWAALGNTGWSYETCCLISRRPRTTRSCDDDFHGTGGPLNVANSRPAIRSRNIFWKPDAQLQLPMNADFNGADQMGLGVYQVTQKNGERWSAARAYIEPNMSRPNLKVITGAQARKILFDGKRAIGIEFSRDGKNESVRARGEVIVSCGAFQSPQLLMLSGVGNAADLKARHRCRAPFARRRRKTCRTISTSPSATVRRAWTISACRSPALRHSGRNRPLPARRRRHDHVERRGGGGFLKTDPNLPVPDIQLHFSMAHGRQSRPQPASRPRLRRVTSACCGRRAAAA